MNKLKKITYEIKNLKEVGENEEMSFEAIASTSALDRDGESISEEALKSVPIGEYSMLLYHNPTKPIGRIEVLGYDDGLKVKGYLVPTEEGKDTYIKLKHRAIKSLSIGFIGKEISGNEWVAIELLEISLVTIPANPEALITDVKALEENEKKTEVKMDLEELTKRVEDLEEKVSEIMDTLEGNKAKEEEAKKEEDELKEFKKMFEIEDEEDEEDEGDE